MCKCVSVTVAVASALVISSSAPAQSMILQGGVQHNAPLQTAPVTVNYTSLARWFLPCNVSRTRATTGVSLSSTRHQAAARKPIVAQAIDEYEVISWDAWHERLSRAIYVRWSPRVTTGGKAEVQITVKSDRSISAKILKSSGDRRFDRTLVAAIASLNSENILHFPEKTRRKSVQMKATYVASVKIQPRYFWKTNDREKVRK